MATLDAVAFNSLLNTEVTDVVYGDGSLVEFTSTKNLVGGLPGGNSTPTATTIYPAGSGVKSVGIGFNKLGDEVRTVVYNNGNAYQNGVFQGSGVESETVTFSPTFAQINTVVYANGQLYQFDSVGPHFLGTNVLSAGLTYDLLGNAVEDVVFTNHSWYEFDSVDNSAHQLAASGVVSANAAIGLLFGEVQEVVYTTGDEYQYGNNPLLGPLTLGIIGPTAVHNGKVF